MLALWANRRAAAVSIAAAAWLALIGCSPGPAKPDASEAEIAHRLSTVRTADRIYVLKDGATVEEGTHDELLAWPEGVYRTLTLLQLEGSPEAVGSGV